MIGTIEGRSATPADILHPALLGGALQSIAGLFADSRADDTAFVAVGAEWARLFRRPRGAVLRSVLRAVRTTEEGITADLALFDEDARTVFHMTGLAFRRVPITRPALADIEPSDTGRPRNRAPGNASATDVGPAFDPQEWTTLPEEGRRASAGAFLRSQVAELLRFPDPGDLPEGATFFELGMDSLILMRLKNAVETAFRIPLEVGTIIENPTADTLADVLVARATAGPAGERSGQ